MAPCCDECWMDDEPCHDVGILISGPLAREPPGTATTGGGLGVAVINQIINLHSNTNIGLHLRCAAFTNCCIVRGSGGARPCDCKVRLPESVVCKPATRQLDGDHIPVGLTEVARFFP
jgi:hypothetical protein